MKLYELTGSIKDLEAMVENGEVPADQVKDTLALLEGDFNEKAANIVKVFKNTNTDAIDGEIKRLQAMKKAITNKKESLKDYLRENMEALGISKIESEAITVLCKKPSAKAVIENINDLPDEFVSIETVVKADSKAVLKALKDGEDVQGASLAYSKSPIEIK